jgi:2-methylisocitrate lyase-like PEP mutase family enzyme
MVQKLSVALEARSDPDLVLIARTDARGTEGFDAAVARAQAYAKAGADMIFFEAPEAVEEIRALPSLIDAPLIINLVEGGKTPMMTAEELQGMGYKVVLYANTALRSSVKAVQDAMRSLRETGNTGAITSEIISWDERQRLLRLATYQDIEARHLSARE